MLGLNLAKESFGPVDEDVALNLNNLAEMYHKQGRLAQAETFSRRALAILEKALDTPASRICPCKIQRKLKISLQLDAPYLVV